MADVTIATISGGAVVAAGVDADDKLEIEVDGVSHYVEVSELGGALNLVGGLPLSSAVVLKSLYDAHTVLYATTDNTPAALTVAVDTVVGRITGGNIASLYPYGFPVAINAQTGTTYTTVLSDVGKIITSSNASAQTITIPTNASVAYPLGTVLTIVQKGAGQVTVAGAVPPTLNTSSSLKTRGQFSVIQLYKDLTDTWTVYGDLEPIGQSINAQTGTSYTFVLSDADDWVTASNASAQTYTVPPNSSVAYPIGSQIDITQVGAGQVTLAQGSGVTLQNFSGLKLAGQHASAVIKKRLTDTWTVAGNMTT